MAQTLSQDPRDRVVAAFGSGMSCRGLQPISGKAFRPQSAQGVFLFWHGRATGKLGSGDWHSSTVGATILVMCRKETRVVVLRCPCGKPMRQPFALRQRPFSPCLAP